MSRIASILLPFFLFAAPIVYASSDDRIPTGDSDTDDDGEEPVDIDLAAIEQRATQHANDRESWRTCSFFRCRRSDLHDAKSAVTSGAIRGATAYIVERAINTTVTHHHAATPVVAPVVHALGSLLHCSIL